ncbi:MAG: vitamin K epoxide reductase family protein [Thermoprotei archaeon]
MRRSGLFFIIIGTIGIIVSILLMLDSLSASSYCLIGSSCLAIVQSEYAYLFSIPLWFLALVGFILYTLLGILYTMLKNVRTAYIILLTIFIGSVISSILAFYLISIELYILHTICSYCSILHLLIFSSSVYTAYILIAFPRQKVRLSES